MTLDLLEPALLTRGRDALPRLTPAGRASLRRLAERLP